MRQRVTIGDIYEVPYKEKGIKAYFQYLMKDYTQMNTNVIKVFKTHYREDENPTIEDILNDEVDFYIHTSILAGVKQGLWKKIGNRNISSNFERPYFISSKDDSIDYSERWYVWQAGDEDYTYVGKLPQKYHKWEEGSIYPPFAIVDRIFKGDTGFKKPKFKKE